MKAVIVEIEGNYAIALDKKGDFIKLKKRVSYKVGYEVDIASASSFQLRTAVKIASIAAVFFLIVGLSIGAYCYTVPYTYINVDINPSVEITANIFNRIIKVEGINEDGKKLLQNTGSRNKSIRDGIGSILESAIESGYLKDKKSSAVLFTVSGKSKVKVESLEKDIKNTVAKELKTAKVEADVVIRQISIEKHNESRKAGVSPGKRKLIEELRELGAKDKEENLEKAPVKQLIDEMKTLKNKKSIPENSAKADQPVKKAGEGSSKVPEQVKGKGEVKKADNPKKIENPKKPDNTEKPDNTKKMENSKKTENPKKIEDPKKGLKGGNKPADGVVGTGPKEQNKENNSQQNKIKQNDSKGPKNKNEKHQKANSGNNGQGKEKQDISPVKEGNDLGGLGEVGTGDSLEQVKTNNGNSYSEDQTAKQNDGLDTVKNDDIEKDKVNGKDKGNGNGNNKGNGKSNGNGNNKK